jgi:DNA polymerase-3 subunit delta
MTYEAVLKDLKAGKYSPVYFFHGDEPFYIDQLSDWIAANALSDLEKEFNQTILYGKETDGVTVMQSDIR